jgi:hypothetical protein
MSWFNIGRYIKSLRDAGYVSDLAKDVKQINLEIYNLMGAKVLSRANANKEENINASSLQSGVYILVVKGSGNKSFSQKFVIN